MLHFSGNVSLLSLGVGCVPMGLGPCIQTTQSRVISWCYPKLIIHLGCCAYGIVEDFLCSVLAQPIINSLSSLKSNLEHLCSTILKKKLYKSSLNDLFGFVFFKFIYVYFLKSPRLVCIRCCFIPTVICCGRGLIFTIIIRKQGWHCPKCHRSTGCSLWLRDTGSLGEFFLRAVTSCYSNKQHTESFSSCSSTTPHGSWNYQSHKPPYLSSLFITAWECLRAQVCNINSQFCFISPLFD